MIHVGSIVIRVDDLEPMVDFWSEALHYVPRDRNDPDFVLLRPPDGNGPNVSLDKWHADVQVPPKIHLDLYADDQAAQVERLVGLGATVVRHHEDPDDDYVVLTDPEGNEFCVCAVPSG